MDLLFTRYADPFSFMDGYIAGGRFGEFLCAFIEINAEAKAWECYLHKYFDETWDEFRSKALAAFAPPAPPRKEDLEATVAYSRELLAHFNPLQ